MKLNSKDDKPSCLSKRVMRVYSKNQTESVKLNEKLDRLEKAKVHNLDIIAENVRSLRHTSRKIKEVIKEMDVSQMRRRMFADHGCKLTEEKINISELLERIDGIIYNPIGTPIPIICNKTFETDHDSLQTEVNKLNDIKKPGTDVISAGNIGNEDTRPFEFRKIIPPLKGRKMEEVYKDIKQEGKQPMNVRELTDFRRGSKNFEINSNGKQNELEKEERERRYFECQKQNEIVKLKESFENLLDFEPNDKTHCNGKISCTKNDEKAIQNATFYTNHPKTIHNNAKVANKAKKEDNSKNIRPMSCPPNSFANKSNVTVRARKFLSSGKDVCSQKQVRRCWDEHVSKSVSTDYVNSTKQTTLNEKSRPKSCSIALQDERMRSCSSPPPQRKISRPLTTESHKRIRNPSCGNRSDMGSALIYDARPRGAITSGYATLQMRIGRKSTCLFVPKFRRVLLEDDEMTEKQKTSKLKMEKRRIERVKKQLELEEYRV